PVCASRTTSAPRYWSTATRERSLDHTVRATWAALKGNVPFGVCSQPFMSKPYTEVVPSGVEPAHVFLLTIFFSLSAPAFTNVTAPALENTRAGLLGAARIKMER